jgi:phospholipase/carboxylesterase
MHKYDIRERGRGIEDASKALILLHGRGATAENILTLADFFTDETWYVAAPQATDFQWYPYSFLTPVSQNEPWLTSAIEYIRKLIDSISRHIPVENIYLMGFSQGACLSAEIAARYAREYGGIGVFTGGLIGDEPDPGLYRGDLKGTRIYISNGDNDPHIPMERSDETKRQFEKMGASVRYDIFPGRAHTIIQQEIENAKEFFFETGRHRGL